MLDDSSIAITTIRQGEGFHFGIGVYSRNLLLHQFAQFDGVDAAFEFVWSEEDFHF
jgi:hypothetical protein